MTDSTRQSVLFPDLQKKPIRVEFDEPMTTSDGGALLLKGIDEKLGVTETLAAYFEDGRTEGKRRHTTRDLIQQRVFALALGYPDGNDASRVADDPMHKLLLDRDPVEGERLASQSTISRFENAVGAKSLLRLGRSLADTLLAWQSQVRNRKRVRRVTIDLDPSDDPSHGSQEGIAFNGHYDCHCYLPLLCFVSFDDEPEQYAIGALLRGGRATPTKGAFWMLRRVFDRVRRYFPKAKIRVRLDGGFAGPELLSFLEQERVEYLVGIGGNSRLAKESLDLELRAWEAFDEGKETVTLFGETQYAAGSWNGQQRRVVIKAEVVQHPGRLPRENIRYVVTNMRHKPSTIYEIYRQRGDAENRIKELFDGMAIGRTSCHRFAANQFRLLLTLAAYMLMQELRRRLARHSRHRPQVERLRLMLLKIGGRIEASVRRIVVHLAKSHPWSRDWTRIARRLGAVPT